MAATQIPTGEDPRPTRRLGPWLWLLLAIFVLRVLGQIAVVLWGPPWLPPMEEWMSGAIPYPLLLTSQILIIWLLATVSHQFTKGRGWFTRPNRKIGRFLLWFGSIYLIVMAIRYAVRMSLYPEERWTGLSIPIFLHWVLATFVLSVALHHLRHAPPVPRRLWLRIVLIAFAGLSLCVWVAYLLLPAWLGAQLGFKGPLYAVKVHRSVPLRTSDGIDLVSDLYLPRRAGRVPTILVRLPYSKSLDQRLAATIVGRMWAEHGYNVVLQGVRGRYESGGEFYPLRHERQDGLETLRWLERQPWFDGRLGMWGGSYFGHTQWVVADHLEPGRSALIVQIAGSSFYDMFYQGHALALESALFWALTSAGAADVPPSSAQLDKGYGRLPLIEADDRAGRDVVFFNDWVSHPERDSYWREADGEKRWSTLRSPVLLMGGWFDPFLPALLSDYANIKAHSPGEIAEDARLVIGPWAHAYAPKLPGGFEPSNYRMESLAVSIPWFDRNLKHRLDAPEFAPVRLFVMGENVWRDEREWPLARTRYTPYFFAAEPSHSLVEAMPRKPIELKYEHDPANPVPSRGGAMLGPRAGPWRQNLKPRSDVLEFSTRPLSEAMEITGPVRAVLFVRTSAPSTDFIVTLNLIAPAGEAYKLTEGVLRRSYEPGRLGGAGEPERIEIELWPTSYVVPKGWALRACISSSSTPRFDVNLGTGRPLASETELAVAKQSLFLGGETPSCLTLPVIPRGR